MTCTVPVFGQIRGVKKFGTVNGSTDTVKRSTVRHDTPAVRKPTVTPPQIR